MGGYAPYVWSAFAVAFVLMLGLFVQSRGAARRGAAELEALRGAVRPQRPRPARPLRPTREATPAEPPVGRSA